jgi:transcriptional regulator GlxA family with amidase domain
MSRVSQAGRARHRVAVVVLDGFLPIELGIAHRIFGTARDDQRRELYDVVTCSVGGPGQVRSNADFAIHVPHGPEVIDTADTVLFPASYELGPVYDQGLLTPELRAGFDRIRPGTRLMSICLGSFLLAAAGVLDGRPATTHWADADQFRRLFPRVRLEPDVLYVDDGDVLTSAGVAAGIDLCLHVVRRDHGAAVADDVARRTVVPPHRDGGQAQFIRRPVREPAQTSTAPARAWALEHLDDPLPLSALAARCAMSVRTFTRRFREETGESPGQWVQRRRIEHARSLLETTDLPVEQVAAQAGLGSAQSLRAHLSAALGVTPTAYRRTFRRAG